LTKTTTVITHSTKRLMACLGEPSNTSITVCWKLWVCSDVVTSTQVQIKSAPPQGCVSVFKASTVFEDVFPDFDFTHGQSVI
jgi:hypothetical protein